MDVAAFSCVCAHMHRVGPLCYWTCPRLYSCCSQLATILSNALRRVWRNACQCLSFFFCEQSLCIPVSDCCSCIVRPCAQIHATAQLSRRGCRLALLWSQGAAPVTKAPASHAPT